MQNNQSKKMAHSVVMVALFTILTLIAYYVPLVNLVAYFVAPLPIVWFSANYDRNATILMSVASAILTFLFGGLGILLISILFIATGIVIGEGLRAKKSKLFIYLSTSITVLIIFAIQYIILVKVFSIDFIQTSLDDLRKTYEEVFKATNALQTSMSTQEMSPTEILDTMFQSLEMAMPSIITIGVFLYSIVTIMAIFPLLNRLRLDYRNLGTFLI